MVHELSGTSGLLGWLSKTSLRHWQERRIRPQLSLCRIRAILQSRCAAAKAVSKAYCTKLLKDLVLGDVCGSVSTARSTVMQRGEVFSSPTPPSRTHSGRSEPSEDRRPFSCSMQIQFLPFHGTSQRSSRRMPYENEKAQLAITPMPTNTASVARKWDADMIM